MPSSRRRARNSAAPGIACSSCTRTPSMSMSHDLMVRCGTAGQPTHAKLCAAVSHVVVSNVAYAHPGGDVLFSDVSFKVGSGAHIGFVGANGVGKSTLLKILAGRLEAVEGGADIRPCAYMPQDGGACAARARTGRGRLRGLAPPR